MPPTKRKAAEAAIYGEESHVFKSPRLNGRSQTATAAAGRPRRSAGSTTEAKAPAPKPKTKSASKAVNNSMVRSAESTTESDAPKRQGRPPKTLTTAVPAIPKSKTKPISTPIDDNGALKKRGRPPKTLTTAVPTKPKSKTKPTSTPIGNNGALKKRGRPPKTLTTAVPTKPKSKTKPTSTPIGNNGALKKRGRPSKATKEVKKVPKRGTRSSRRLSSFAPTTPANKVSFAKSTATIPKPSTKATSGRPRGRPSAKSILKNGDIGESVSAEEDGADPQNGVDQNGEVADGVSTEAVDGEETENAPSYWLMKAEPETRMEKGVNVKFSIDDLAAANEPQGWDGVRNHVAQKNMREMKSGDLAFFYHSNCKVPGIAGVMEIVQEHSVDESAFDENHPYYDAKSTRDNPKWSLVHVEFRRKLPQMITLTELKSFAKPGGALENMAMIKQSRLSVSKVTAEEWEFIMELVEEEDNADTHAAPIQSKGQAAEPEPNINLVDEKLQEELQDEELQDKKLQDEVLQDEVSQDEVLQDEVSQDEVLQDEVSQDEVLQDEVLQDEELQGKELQDEIREDGMVNGEGATTDQTLSVDATE